MGGVLENAFHFISFGWSIFFSSVIRGILHASEHCIITTQETYNLSRLWDTWTGGAMLGTVK